MIWKMDWAEYVSKTKLVVTDNTIVLLRSLHILAKKPTKNNNHDWICYMGLQWKWQLNHTFSLINHKIFLVMFISSQYNIIFDHIDVK